MRKTEREIKWHKLDNTANVFPVISNEALSSVFRIGVVLKDQVDPLLLEQALCRMLPWFEGMHVRLRRGIFWYYFETNPKDPVLGREITYPCRYIDPYSSNQYLFRVSYYKNKINVEIFHALTDGYGAINFLKELTAQYLHLRYKDKLPPLRERAAEKTSFQVEDSYEKYYVKEHAKGYGGVIAYKLKDEELPPGVMGVTHGFLDIPSLKEICREYEVSITQYLAAVLVYCIYKEYGTRPSGSGKTSLWQRLWSRGRQQKQRPVRINIPVNLRQFFPSETTMNFFGVVFAEMQLETGKEYTFQDMLKTISENFSSQLTKEHMQKLGHLHTGTSREISAEIGLIDSVHHAKIIHIRQEYGGLNHLAVVRACSLQHSSHIFHSLMRLGLHTLCQLPTLRNQPQLTGTVHHAVYPGRLNVGTYRCRSLFCKNHFFCHLFYLL